MKKCIDAEKMISDTKAMKQVVDAIEIDGIIKYIEENAVEKPVGEWLRTYPTTPKSYTRICSLCEGRTYTIGCVPYKYCPNCGAKMSLSFEDFIAEIGSARRAIIGESDLRAMYKAYLDDNATE